MNRWVKVELNRISSLVEPMQLGLIFFKFKFIGEKLPLGLNF